MKTISLWQPWASAIALDLKHFETRSWKPHAGLIGQPLAIHAAQKKDWTGQARWIQHRLGLPPGAEPPAVMESEFRARAVEAIKEFDALPFGAVVCVVKVVRCWTSEGAKERITPKEAGWGNYGPNRFAWELEMVRVLEHPLPVMGRQGIFNVEL